MKDYFKWSTKNILSATASGLLLDTRDKTPLWVICNQVILIEYDSHQKRTRVKKREEWIILTATGVERWERGSVHYWWEGTRQAHDEKLLSSDTLGNKSQTIADAFS